MQFASASCGSLALGSVMADPGSIVDPTSLRPILVELNGIDSRACIRMNTLRKSDTLGQPVTVEFEMINCDVAPVVGDRVRVWYHSQLEFAGTIERVDKISPDLSTFIYHCQCFDWSQILVRRKVNRIFEETSIQSVLHSLLANELLGESLTLGIIDSYATIHLVSADNAKAFDVCRDMASAAGQTFYVDFDQTIHMRSSTSPAAPVLFTEANILLDGFTVQSSRELYRNVQTVIVTGTPIADEGALVTTEQARNEDQIAARAAIEGGTGIYEEVMKVTHPSSNILADLSILGRAVANVQLSIMGTIKALVQCGARGYGFRAGQIATVNLTNMGVIGTFVIQRVSLREVDGQQLFYDLELTSSSAQQRAYESWLKIITGESKVTVQIPGAITHSTQLFSTPGAAIWIVPPGVSVITITAKGASGGGGGGAYGVQNGNGGRGGHSGLAISSVNVMEGQQLDVVVGMRGAPGLTIYAVPTDGHAGTASTVSFGGVDLVSAFGGGGGHHSGTQQKVGPPGAPGTDGGGTGAIVTVGGGTTGGPGGLGVYNVQPLVGIDGSVLIEW